MTCLMTWTRACVACWRGVVTSDDISSNSSGRGRHMTVLSACGCERDTREARVSSYDHQILRLNRSGDDKAVLAACVAEIQAGSQEPSAAHVRVPRAIVLVWWRVRLPLEVECLGFVHDMPWSTFVWLVSSGEGLMCTNLIGRGTDCEMS